MKQYHALINKILAEGEWKNQRAVDSEGNPLKTKSISGAMIEFDLRKGFPILTTKKVPFKVVAVELEGFTKGVDDKSWYKERNCNIWNEWCNPIHVPNTLKGKERLEFMEKQNDLGEIYGVQWREWGRYSGINESIDQLKNIVNELKSNPTSRRLIVNSWNPSDLEAMALPPCHYSFQFISNGKDLDLIFNMRSNDVFLGLPFNITQYALLLSLVAKTVNMTPRKLIYSGADIHIYENHMTQIRELLSRDYEKYQLPTLEISENTDIFNWTHKDVKLNNYQSYPTIKAEVAI